MVECTAELTSANRELDSFAYAISHDPRAPLRAMAGFSQALIEDYGDTLEDEAKLNLDQIGIASQRMGELIDGILALSRSTRGELQCDAIDLSALAADIVGELAHAEPERAVHVEIEPGLVINGDGRMIEAVVRNLLSNTWKYTGQSDAPSSPGRRMHRLHRHDEYHGFGVGLAIVPHFTTRRGGEIRAVAEPGHGADFLLHATAVEHFTGGTQ